MSYSFKLNQLQLKNLYALDPSRETISWVDAG